MARILVIEDETSLREDIAELLGFEGFEVFQAEDGPHGVEMARIQKPDLIVCDIAMPGMTGYDVLEALRADPETMGIPFIFLTAMIERSFVRHGMEMGADDYITKPFTHGELLSAIRSRLARSSKMTSHYQKEADEARRLLSQLVAHELRTPLVTMKMVQDLVTRQINHLSRDELMELMEMMGSGSRRLTHLTEQMVIFTQLEAKIISRKSIREDGSEAQIWPLITSAVTLGRDFAYHGRDGSIRFEGGQGGDVLVRCHIQALRHALAEVIANALDFSPAGQTVELAQWTANQSVYIRITDHGPDIATDQLGQVLKPFKQIDRERREQQGLGLGLALADRVVKAHEGRLNIESPMAGGTIVTIRLPEVKSTAS